MSLNTASKAALSAGKKVRPGYKIQEIPANEKPLGNSEKELGVRWSAGQKKAGPSGKLLRSGGKAQPMPGSLGGGDTSLDQPDESGGDRLQGGLDQPVGTGGDRPEPKGLDQPAKADGDRPGSEGQGTQGNSSAEKGKAPERVPGEERTLEKGSSVTPPPQEMVPETPVSDGASRDPSTERGSTVVPATDRESTEPPLSERASTELSESTPSESQSSQTTWRQGGGGQELTGSDPDEVEMGLLGDEADSEEEIQPDRYFPEESEEDNKSAVPIENESDAPRKIEKTGRKRSAKKAKEKRKKREGRTPTRPTGFREVISSISMAGQANTVSRHERLVAPTAVRFGRGNNIPHGMKFTAKGKAHDDSSGEESDPSEPSDDPDLSMDEG